jgi:phosphoglycerate dehydrogenase-like enzyme
VTIEGGRPPEGTGAVQPIHVLISARVSAAQLEQMRNIHPRLSIHGEPGGIAIMSPQEAARHGIDTGDIEYPEFRPDLDTAALLAQAEVLFATRVPPDITVRAPHLRWIHFTSAGVDHLWQPSFGTARVTVTCSKGIHAIPMAEFVLSAMLVFAKQWPRLIGQQQAHQWQKFVVHELHGRTLVLLGVGEIGRAIARLAQACGMHVIGVRRHVDRDRPDVVDEVCPPSRLSDILPRGDFVVSTLPLTPSTRGMMDERLFRAMQSTAVFINVGRGRTVHQEAMVRALREQWIAGAALDVLDPEPLPADHPLWDLPNVLISPHMGSDTARVIERMTGIFYDNLQRYGTGEPLRNVVDPVEAY